MIWDAKEYGTDLNTICACEPMHDDSSSDLIAIEKVSCFPYSRFLILSIVKGPAKAQLFRT